MTKRSRNYTSKPHLLHILMASEKNCSGETIAMDNIYQNIRRNNRTIFKKYTCLKNSNFVEIVKWLLNNQIYWCRQIIKNRSRFSIFYTSSYASGLSASLLKKIFKYKIVFHYHGSRIPNKSMAKLNLLKKITQLFKYSLIYQLHAAFISSTDLIIVPSKLSQQRLKKEFKINKEKIVIIKNGVDKSRFIVNLNKKYIKQKIKLANKKIITVIASLNERKNLLKTIKIFQKIAKKQTNYHLILKVRKPKNKTEIEYQGKVRNLINKLNLKNSVTLLGKDQPIAEILKISDLVFINSKYEDFSLVTLESLASGTIFFTTTVGFPKKIATKLNPILFSKENNDEILAKQIIKIIQLSKKQKTKILNKSKRIISQHSWENIGRLVEKKLISLTTPTPNN